MPIVISSKGISFTLTCQNLAQQEGLEKGSKYKKNSSLKELKQKPRT